MKIVSRLVFAGALLLAAGSWPSLGHAEGDAARGRELAYTCLGCHGIEGYRNAYPSYRVPKLGGQKAGYIELALKAYRSGTRPHPTMQAQGTSLSDRDIADLAAYFQGDTPLLDEVTAETVAGVAAAGDCLPCHGNAARGLTPTPPTLSGQYASYLVHALRQYRDGARGNTVMTAFANRLTDAEIEALAQIWRREQGLTTPDSDE